jgi:hypothetical protein
MSEEKLDHTLKYGMPIRMPKQLAKDMVTRLNGEGSQVYEYRMQHSGEYAIVAAYSKSTGKFVAYYNFDMLLGPGFHSRDR